MKGLKSESSGDQQKEKDQTLPHKKRGFKKKENLKKREFKKESLKKVQRKLKIKRV
ncbi:hypothetical protein VN1250_13710 [Helicobacter pylori]|nr:hypothetical protein VN1250_13710 [Helicobacter pylori]